MNHTPLPWRYEPELLYNGQHVAGRGPHVVANGMCIRLSTEHDADAQYIVQACNSFPDLVEACKALVTACDTAPPVDLVQHIGKCCSMARAALKKAGG